MTAVLQLEFSRKRHPRIIRETLGDARGLCEEVMKDVITNGGTMVLVVSAETITLVQRAEVEDLTSVQHPCGDDHVR